MGGSEIARSAQAKLRAVFMVVLATALAVIVAPCPVSAAISGEELRGGPTPTVVAEDSSESAEAMPPFRGDARAEHWSLAQLDPPSPPAEPSVQPAVYGPPSAEPAPPPPATVDPRYDSFLGRVGAVKWELALSAAFLTAVNLPKDIRHGTGDFHFSDEGWFGDNTDNLGVDKVAHAYNGYLFSEIMYQRMRRKTGDGPAPAATSALLGFGLQLYGEVFDGFERTGGWSWQDVAFDALGSGISFVRNAVPGLKDKVDFRILIMPNHDFYTVQGKAHFEQQRFLLALKLSGFEAFRHGPLRFVELHAGYYASGFTRDQRAEGVPLRRRPFVGIGINLQELFFRHPTGWLSKAARTVLQYVQVPYTAASVDVHGHVSD